jgi:hypothetical protein
MELASAYINKQDNLVECWNKCLREKSFCTPLNANGVNIDSLFNELRHETYLFNKNNPDPDD